ncbi:MAG: hypothetical protein R3F31_14945 [Verrucomicrobiales bacterium]
MPRLAAESPAAQKLSDFQRVVIADDANAVQRAAADELASHVSRITGRKVETMKASAFALATTAGPSFFVGDGAAEMALGKSPKPWKTEEWMLRSVPRGLVLAGDDGVGDPWSIATAAGSMLAVYTLLEDHLGVRWFWPGAFGEHVPENAEALVPGLWSGARRDLRFDRWNSVIPAFTTRRSLTMPPGAGQGDHAWVG